LFEAKPRQSCGRVENNTKITNPRLFTMNTSMNAPLTLSLKLGVSFLLVAAALVATQFHVITFIVASYVDGGSQSLGFDTDDTHNTLKWTFSGSFWLEVHLL
jgi:hypothetical protein